MPGRVITRQAARRDLDALADYIGQRNRAAGRRFYDAAQQAMKQLAAGPLMGSACEFAAAALKELRFWRIRGFENYLIFYLPHPEGITVVRVLHGARDIEAIFGPNL